MGREGLEKPRRPPIHQIHLGDDDGEQTGPGNNFNCDSFRKLFNCKPVDPCNLLPDYNTQTTTAKFVECTMLLLHS